MEALINKTQLAQMLGISIKTIDLWMSKGYGPQPVYMGRLVRFRSTDVEAFVESLNNQKENKI
jgi:predicted DNA-binding transcriptional regulator AlpA